MLCMFVLTYKLVAKFHQVSYYNYYFVFFVVGPLLLLFISFYTISLQIFVNNAVLMVVKKIYHAHNILYFRIMWPKYQRIECEQLKYFVSVQKFAVNEILFIIIFFKEINTFNYFHLLRMHSIGQKWELRCL